MPKERKEFSAADSKFRRIMAATEKTPDVLAICAMDGLLEDLSDANKVRERAALLRMRRRLACACAACCALLHALCTTACDHLNRAWLADK